MHAATEFRQVLVARAAVLMLMLAIADSPLHAQLLYSFESGLDGFVATGQSDSDYIDHFQTTLGATAGSMALGIETGSGFGRDVLVNESTPGTPAYDLLNTVAANPELYTLDFDVSFTTESWANLVDVGSFFAINVASNSDAGFRESFGVANGQPGSASSVSASLPATQLSLAPNSSFYQLTFGSNSNHTNGLGGEGVQYFIDNVRFAAVPQFDQEILFSWETPDDPGTPDVNESLEGWQDGFGGQPYFHTRSITTEGATDGNSALRFQSPQSGFSWGSQFFLDSGESGDPALQPAIDDLIASVNSADRIAFDVTFADDQFPGAPTFLSLFLNVSDQSGTFYQSPALQAGNPVSGGGNTITLEVPLSELTAGSMNLADDGLMSGTFFRIALATNSNDSTNFIIDNFRLLTEISAGLDGDYNEDGVVNIADYTVWRDNLGANDALPNDPTGGVVGAAQYETWKTNFGASQNATVVAMSAATAAVPEPASFCIAMVLGMTLLTIAGRRPLATSVPRAAEPNI